MSILNILLLLSILTLSPLTHALEEALGTPTTVTPSPLAVPIAQADPATLLESALQLREAKPALFGGALGVLIMKVVPGSQAEKVGLRRGDIVVAYQGKGINSFEELVNTVQASADEATVTLQFIRGEKVEEVVLGDGKMGVELRNLRSAQAIEFAEQLKAAVQVEDLEKMVQLIRDNPQLAKEILPPSKLATLEQIRPELEKLLKQGLQDYEYSNYHLAIETWQTGLERSRQLKDKRYISQFLTNLGAGYQNLGQYNNALKHYEEALAIEKEFDDSRGGGGVLTNLGVVYYELGQYPKALEYHEKALAIHQKIDDRRGEGADLTNLGAVYFDLGQYEKALEHYKKALVIHKELDDRSGEGSDLTNLGVAYKNLGDYEEALKYYKKALAIDKEIDDRRGEGIDHGNLGNVYSDLGQNFEAMEHHKNALKIDKEIGNHTGEGLDLINMGIVYDDLGQYSDAKTAFENSVAILSEIGSSNLWLAQRGRASVDVHLNQPQNAIHHYEQALDNIEQLRASLTGGIEKATGLPARTLKTDFMQDKFYVYDELINLYHDQGDDQKAFETFERKQGRAFLEDMAQSGVRQYVDLPVAISQKEETLETQVEAARKILGEAAGKGDEAVKAARDLLATAVTAQRTFQAELKVKYPHYYALKHPQPVKLPDLQQKVLQEGELLLIYNVRKEATDLWLVGKQHFQMFSLPVTEAQVKEQVAKFRQTGVDSILQTIKETKESEEKDRRTRINNAVEDSLPDFLNISHALYQQLLPESVQQLLKAAKPTTLYIVPTGALYSLPFEALVTEKGESPHYLIQDYAVSYLSSASLLKTLRDAKQPRHTEAQQPLLAFAHPVYDKTAFAKLRTEDSFLGLRTQAYLKLVGGGESFPELPETAKEATGIAKVLKADEHYLKLRKEASKQQVLEEQHLDNFRYVLFAAHAVAPEKVTPIEQPALILSLTTPDQDAYLTMADVFGLSLKADLVTLSACNTGQGELVHGEGVLGLTRAFMYAGTPAVSVTLWKIETDSSQALTTGLFTQLQQKQLLAAGLRQTKLDLLTGGPEEYYRHPYFWAGMVVFGDGK